MKTEIIIAFREWYESRLSQKILENPNLVSIVNKISYVMLELMDKNNIELLSLSEELADIEKEFFNKDYFGRLGEDLNHCHKGPQIISHIKMILSSNNAPLELVMHTHALYMRYIYDKLPHKIPGEFLTAKCFSQNPSFSEHIVNKILENPQDITQIKKEKVVNPVFFNELFFRKDKLDRSRISKNPEEVKRTEALGIIRNNFFQQKVGIAPYLRKRAADIFLTDKSSSYADKANALKTPIVAGPSGNAGGLILNAILLANMSSEEMQEYGLACIAYLIGGGNHSFEEIACVLDKVGIPYIPGEYEPTLPLAFKNSKVYKELLEETQKYLEDYMYSQNNQFGRISPNEYREFANLYKILIGTDYVAKKTIKCLEDWRALEKEIVQTSKSADQNKGIQNQVSRMLQHETLTYPALQPAALTKFFTFSVSFSLQALLQLSGWTLSLLGITSPPTSTSVEFFHLPTYNAQSFNQTNKLFEIIIGKKNMQRYPDKAADLINFMEKVLHNIVDEKIKVEFYKIIEIPAVTKRFKALDKLKERWKAEQLLPPDFNYENFLYYKDGHIPRVLQN